MARVLGVSPSGYYAWRNLERSAREQSDEALSARVREIHQRSRGTLQLVRRSIETGTGCFSYQVVQETLNVATRRLGFAADDSCTLLADVLVPLWTVHPGRELYERGLALRDRYGFSFHDSMIVAGAIQSGCVRLYSEDLQHGQRTQSLTVEDPFRAPVEGRPT